MNRFRVWAPAASRVEIEVDGTQLLMIPGDGGWWTVEVDGCGPGSDYTYRLDGGPPLPDPRSAFQPSGVHGPSRLVDHDAFPWTDGAWRGAHLPSAVVYELHVGTFSPEGTFDGAIERLDHLVALGIDAVELMPVAEFSGDRGWGYDGVDLYAPHHVYGGPDGCKRLVDACHNRGLAVILDVVYNHLGPAGNYLPRFGPYFTDRYRTPWGEAVNLDGPGSDEVRAFFLDNATQWLVDYHMDGLRLDAVHAILDTSAVHFLEELSSRVNELANAVGRRLWLVAESDLNDPRLVRAVDAGGYGLDAQWSDDFHHALHVAITGERSGYYQDFDGIADVVTALGGTFVYAGRFSAHRGRRHGRAASGLPGWKFFGYLQNHDQVGNRAMGERSSMLMSIDRLRVAAALVLLGPFVPMLFQGEEWGASTPFQYFTDHADAELGAQVSEGRRREFASFGWETGVPDPQDPATFARSVLDWDEVELDDHAALLRWHTDLIELRRCWPELTNGRVDQAGVDVRAGVLWFRRGRVAVIANLGSTEATWPGPEGPHRLLAASGPGARIGEDGTIAVPAESVAVVAAAEGRHGVRNRRARGTLPS